MKNEILIQFSQDQWRCLEPHIQDIASDVDGIYDWFTNQPDHMIRCDEDVYERLIAVAAKHCSDLISLIEKEKQRSLQEAALRKK